MAFATASSPANRKPGDNAQTATPPQTQARPRQSPGNAEPPTRARAPACARARQRAPGPQRMPGPPARQSPPAHARTPNARQSPSARRDENRAPERQPSRPSDFGALIEPSIGLRDVNRAERRVPRALAGPSSESPRRRIVNFVRPWSKQAILRSLKAKTRDYLRYREAHTRTTGKNVHFPLPRPRKTVCFDRQRPNRRFFASRAPRTGAQRRSKAETPSQGHKL